MKKRLSALLIMVMLFSMASVTAFANGNLATGLSVLLNGKTVSVGSATYVMEGNSLVPYKSFAGQLGAEIVWDAAAKKVIVRKGSVVAEFTHNAKHVRVNGVEAKLDAPVQIIDGTTYGPVRFLAELFGYKVGYDAKSKRVSIESTLALGFNVYGVAEGQMLNGDSVKVAVAVFNHQLTDFREETVPVAGHGHVHLWMDGDPSDPKSAYKMVSGEAVSFDHLQPGKHTLTVQLVGNNHKPLAPDVKKTVTFTTAAVPELTISGVTEGQVIHGNEITVQTSVKNIMLRDFRTYTQPQPGEGHIHLWLDTDVNNPKIAYKQVNAEPVVFKDLQPGEHTLTVQLVGNNHKPVEPQVMQVIHFRTAAAESMAAPIRTYTVNIANFDFAPGNLDIAAGDRVTFINQDEIKHTATSDSGLFDSGLLGKGESFTYTFDKPGAYPYHCIPHPMMKGTITVK